MYIDNDHMMESNDSNTDAGMINRRPLSAMMPDGETLTVRISVGGKHMVFRGPEERMAKSLSEGSRRKSSRIRSDSAASEPTLNGNSEKRNHPRGRAASEGNGHNGMSNRSPPNPELQSNGTSSKDGKFVQNILGDDGNQYYCAVCLDVGDVVCCDGCPKVFHPKCIPAGCDSRLLMDTEEDLWFCPDCISKGKENSNGKMNRKQGATTNDGTNGSSGAGPDSEEPTNHKRERHARAAKNASSLSSPPPKRKASQSASGSPNQKKRRAHSIGADEEVIEDGGHDFTPYESQLDRNEKGLVRAVPPFYYYLLDNRIRLERQLGRKNRYFKKAMRGYERNLMVAKEGLVWFKRLSKADRRRYLEHSMKEFEENVVLWKEEETIREMIESPAEDDNNFVQDTSIALDVHSDDEKYWNRKFRNLVSLSQIECNRSRSQQNTILMEVLQDSRFHPLPMMTPNREPSSSENPDYSGMVVPHFNVQGPIATSVGDQCIGCIRGWNHFCPILGRCFPAVQHRAKLQPPYPSLIATRVGAGMASEVIEDSKVMVSGTKRFKDVATVPLIEPSTRGDDVMNFVEKLVAVKISADTKESQTNGKVETFCCGKCKSTIKDSQGCVTCRRAQLLVDAAKQEGGDGMDSSVRISTSMLPRANIKMDDFEHQSESDKTIATALTAKPWKPNAVLPPTRKYFPTKKSVESIEDEQDQNAGTSEMSENEEPMIKRPARKPDENDNSQDTDDSNKLTKRVARRISRRAGPNMMDNDNVADNRAREEAYKEESSQLQTKCLSISMCGILLGLIRRDPLRLFAEPVPANVEGYHKIIKNPIDFSKIKEKVLEGEYTNLTQFAYDVKLLCINSLIYNPPGTIYSTTATMLREALDIMQKRASDWILAIKNAHASYYSRRGRIVQQQTTNIKRSKKRNKRRREEEEDMHKDNDPFYGLRKSWPGAIELLEENGEWMRSQLATDFMRTKENEASYYGALAIRRAAAAAEASLAPFHDADNVFQPSVRRSHIDDEMLRNHIDERVAKSSDLAQLQCYPSWREGDVLSLLKKVQKWRVEKKTSPDDLCARCVSSEIHGEAKLARFGESNRKRRKTDDIQVRVSKSRKKQSTGLASKRERERIASIDSKKEASSRSVTVKGSQIQGWGLYADHPFQKGDIVAEYVGEYIVNPMADKREKKYEENRIQDYQFKVSANRVIDATKHGGFARYINHSCDPNCMAKIIDGDPPNQHLKRVVVTSQRTIEAGEEITYDYQFPIELDLDARLPCSCGAKSCRGFMNWDLPETTSMISRARTTRGRKERIRNLVRKEMK